MGAGCPCYPLRTCAGVCRSEVRCHCAAVGEHETRLTPAVTRACCAPKRTGWGAVVAMIHENTKKTCFWGYFDKITMVLPNHGLEMPTVTQPLAGVGWCTITRLQAGAVPTWIVAYATIAETTVTAETFHVELPPSAQPEPLRGACVAEVQGLRKW